MGGRKGSSGASRSASQPLCEDSCFPTHSQKARLDGAPGESASQRVGARQASRLTIPSNRLPAPLTPTLAAHHDFLQCPGSTYQTSPHPARYSELKPYPHTLKRLSIVRTTPHGPDRNHDGCAGGTSRLSALRPGDTCTCPQQGWRRAGASSRPIASALGQCFSPSPRKSNRTEPFREARIFNSDLDAPCRRAHPQANS